jgi:ElaB/YqjD/DUF883 family membrane-anchored ribosome-binding protein
MNSEQTSGSTSLAVPTRTGTRPEEPSTGAQDIRSKAGDAVSKLAEAAQQAGQQAKDTATSLASEANEKAKGVMNQQIAAGADWVGHVAEATKAAADSLTHDAPQLSGLVRDAADKVERFSHSLKDQSVEQLFQSASNFTRRQPAVVFGSAALFGFFIFRLLKTSTSTGDPTLGGGERSSESYRSGLSHGA